MGQKFDLIRKSDIFSHLSSLKYVSRWVVLLMDIFLCIIAFALATFLTWKYSIHIPHISNFSLLYRLLMLLVLQITFFWIFHTYSGVLRYSGFVDVSKVILAVGTTSLFAWIINTIVYAATEKYIYSNLGLVLYFLFAFFLLFALRYGTKTIFGYLNLYSGNATRVMIYGTKSAGIAIAKMLRSIENETYRVVGFIDDKENVVNRLILGLKVFPKDEHLITTMRKLRVNKVIVSALKMQSINTSTVFYMHLPLRIGTTTAHIPTNQLHHKSRISELKICWNALPSS